MAEKLGEVLVRKGLITAAQLEEVLKAQLIYGGRLGTNLVELGYLQLKDLAAALGEQRRFPVATAEEMEAASERVSALLKPAQAGKLMAYPLMLDGRRLKVAMANPYEPKEVDELGFITGLRIVPVLAPELLIQRYLEKRYGIVYKPRYIRLSPEDAKSVRMSNVPPPGAVAAGGAEGGATLPGLTVVAEPARPRDVGMFGSLQPGQYLADDEHEVAPAPAPAVAPPKPVAQPAPAVAATQPAARPLAPPAVPLPPARPPVAQGGPASVSAPLPPRLSGPVPTVAAGGAVPLPPSGPPKPPAAAGAAPALTASLPPAVPLPTPAPASASVGQGAASPVTAPKPAATVTPAPPAPEPQPVLEVLPLPAPPGAPEGLFGSWGDAIVGLGAPAPAPVAAAPAPVAPAPVALPPPAVASPAPVASAPVALPPPVTAPAPVASAPVALPPPAAVATAPVALPPPTAAAPATVPSAPVALPPPAAAPAPVASAPVALPPPAAAAPVPAVAPDPNEAAKAPSQVAAPAAKAPPEAAAPSVAKAAAPVAPPTSERPVALPAPAQVAPAQAIELPKAEPGKLELASAWEFVRWEPGSGGGEGKPLTASWSGRGLELDTAAAPVGSGHGPHGEVVQGSHWDLIAMPAPEPSKEAPPPAAGVGLGEANWGDFLTPAAAWSATPAQPAVAAEKRPAPGVESAPVAPVQQASATPPKAEAPEPAQPTVASEPMTLKAAVAALREATTPGAVGRALMSWCEGRFHRAFLLSSSLGVARVIRSGGREAGDTSMAMSLRVDLEAPSLLLAAAEQGKVLMSRQPDGLQDEVLFSALAESLGYLLVAPLRVRKSTPGYLVVAGASAFTEPELEEVEHLLAMASEAIERLQGPA